MGYVSTFPNAYIRYNAIDMVFDIDPDASHIVLPTKKRRIYGFYHRTDNPQPHRESPINGPLIIEYKTLKHVVTSAVEA